MQSLFSRCLPHIDLQIMRHIDLKEVIDMRIVIHIGNEVIVAVEVLEDDLVIENDDLDQSRTQDQDHDHWREVLEKDNMNPVR